MSLLLLNIQSIRSKISELELFLACNEYPSIVIITEHWLNKNETVFIERYTILSKFCRTNFIHGGTLILGRSDFLELYDFTNIERFDNLCCDKDFEISVVYCACLKLYIVCIYRSPISNHNIFLVNLEAVLSNLSPHVSVILTGDFNINYNDENSNLVNNLKFLLESFGLAMHVNNFTRIVKQSGSILDYVCSNICSNKIVCSVISAGLSDHEAVLCSYSVDNCKSKKKQTKRGRIYSKRNFARFKRNCSNHDWAAISRDSNSLNLFYSNMVDIFKRSFPIVNIKPKNKKPWFTKGLKVSSKNMRCLHTMRKYFYDNLFFVTYFNAYRKVYRNTITLAKDKFYGERIEAAPSRQREIWKIVNEFRGNSSVHSNFSSLNADDINSFYCSIAQKLYDKIESAINDPYFNLRHINVPETFYFWPVDRVELKMVLNDFKNKTSSGYDEISVKLMTYLPDTSLECFCQAINRSVLTGIFPVALKMANVIPLFKGGERNAPSDYRPISLLPTFSKVIEKIMKNRFLTFLEKHKLISNVQFGFQSAKNTDDAIFNLMEELYLSLNDGEVASAVFCDLTKAFDCVNHRVLLGKLEIYGFRGSVLDWLQSYLSCRSQRVIFQGCSSTSLNIESGVPQGSVLGPLLFLLYVNDLPSSIEYGKCTSFADDTTLLWHHKDPQILKEMIDIDLLNIKRWCDANFLCFNVSKTNILNFKCSFENITIANQMINSFDANKFLGIHIDNKLKFSKHISCISSKLASGCFAIRTVRHTLGYNIARSVYFALIESRLRYGVCFWGSSSQFLMNSVFVLQKRALRYLCGLGPQDSCRAHFVSERILTVYSIFILETVCLIQRKYADQIHSESVINTRSSVTIRLPIPSSALIKNSFVYGGKKLFNALPDYIRSIKPYRLFRNKVKVLLLSKGFYSVNEYLDCRFN